MLVYRVKNEHLGSNIVHLDYRDALEEILDFVTDGEIQIITISIEEMSQDEYNSLPEFEGY